MVSHPAHPTGARQIRSTRFAAPALDNHRTRRRWGNHGSWMAQPGYSSRTSTNSCVCRWCSACIPLMFRGRNMKPRRGTVCASDTTWCAPVETGPRNATSPANRARFHAANSSRLRWRICSCRPARSKAAAAFSSNRAGNTSNGYRVTHARAAASAAARRNWLANCGARRPASRSATNCVLSRSSPASCRSRNLPEG